ncbi:MAG: ubiquinol-cytochrome c reductase cytochrome b subunit [Candidatus Eremiobacteraeota bacterium]|nr:ubiquinol-cytochrome c reductase cytochrome b subunit [Candidatus Eremiobacteraeota bacterium]MBC5801799.1 ubiquinol-cytochrome c reductase cytochrome b subunit [Candidatus Eremiobacteraeota bacterium]MBC5823135.1 ubiquinol-cytochrome c reductase cytochrome b subunit [Candidatus Eremiobacteraeota bacterium]
MIARLITWLDERLPTEGVIKKELLRHVFPDHWSFMLGEIALYCFIALVVTGTWLGFFFHPSNMEYVYHGPYQPLQGVKVSQAYASLLNLSLSVPLGLLMRQTHHWACLVFLAAIICHMMRIFFTGAFRRPREINWIIGTTLLVLAMLEGYLGYSMGDDLLSGVGLRIGDSVALAIPVVGAYLSYLIFGGEFPTPWVADRLFFLHVFLFPAVIAGLIGFHLLNVLIQKHTQFPGKGKTEDNVVGSPMWPNYALKSLALGVATFAVLFALGGLTQINPIWQYGPYHPQDNLSPDQPDWYLGWLIGALRLAWPYDLHVLNHTIPEPFWPAVFMPAALFGFVYLWPWIEKILTGDDRRHELLDYPREAPLRVGVGVTVLTFVILLELAGSDDIQSNLMHISVEKLVEIYQWAAFLVPPVAGFIGFKIASELRARAHIGDEVKPARVVLVRNAAGGYDEEAARSV